MRSSARHSPSAVYSRRLTCGLNNMIASAYSLMVIISMCLRIRMRKSYKATNRLG